jgi:general stress protein YciG
VIVLPAQPQPQGETIMASTEKSTAERGFAAMDERKQKEIASKGGKAAHEKGTAHEFTPEEAAEAGRKGGEAVSSDREHMADIGRKGGEAVSSDRGHMASIGRKGGEAVSSDREHMADIGKKGGEARGASSSSGGAHEQHRQAGEQSQKKG